MAYPGPKDKRLNQTLPVGNKTQNGRFYYLMHMSNVPVSLKNVDER
jgi:hypothetical protein